MLQFKWYFCNVDTEQDIENMIEVYNKYASEYGAVDTETTGLHIVKDIPFLAQFGFIDPERMRGYAYVVDLRTEIGKQALDVWLTQLIQKHTLLAGHNISFDIHMLMNTGHDVFKIKPDTLTLTDTQFYIRYGHDALHTSEGGPPLGLKDYTTRYVDKDAKVHESALKKERTAIAKAYNVRLKQALGITLKQLNEYTKDCLFELEDLPEDLRERYIEWHSKLPDWLRPKVNSIVESDMIQYDQLNTETLKRYAAYDIVYTLEILWFLIPKVKARDNENAVSIENTLLEPIVYMERVGFKCNTKYLEESRVRMKEYILTLRAELNELAEQELSVGQHALIKQIINTKYETELTSTNDEQLKLLYNTTKNEELKQFIWLVQELRTLEKWYSTYILRFQERLIKGKDRLYTQINQVGTVSGRVTSDFQQFPRNGIKDKEGNDLFNPRYMVETDSAIVYLDYSQIELRFQALYTILVNHPDTNLCRAYMPYKCHRASGELFDYNNPEHIKGAYDGSWYHDEDDLPWEPVDVHGATTTAATGLKPGDEGFKEARYSIGKRTNFAKNYNAQLGRIRQMFPDKSLEEVKKIDAAYYNAFPGVKQYHSYCYNRARLYSNTTNLFGVHYYNVSGHKLINMLIQGSAAFYLKKKIIELWEYTKANGLKTKWQMQIHDELSWEWNPEDSIEHFFEFKRIMEDWSDTKVPIVADMEVTTTNWAEKQEIETLEDLERMLENDSTNE